MDIKKIKLELPVKDTMLFISNSILDINVSSNTPKTKMFDKISNAFSNKENILRLISLLSYDAYMKLEKIYTSYINNESVIKSFKENYSDELVDSCLFVLEEIKYSDGSFESLYKYSESVFDNLKYVFSSEGKAIAEKEYLFERVIKGILNTYGIIKKEYFVTFVNDYLDTDYNYDTLLDKIYSKLILNTFVERFTINWKNINESDDFISKIAYSEELGSLAESQKQLNFDYNYHDLDYILKKAETPLDVEHKDIIDNIHNLNPNIDKKVIVNFIDEVIMGIKNATDIIKPIIENADEEKVEDLIDYLAYAHNELELYVLCGYSPNSLRDDKIVN